MVLTLFGIFAVCMLTILLTGAKVYSRLIERGNASYDMRTCAQYIAARVRQADSLGAIATGDFYGSDALIFDDGSGYLTRVYCYDGYISELYSAKDKEMKPEDGEKIIKAEQMTVNADGQLLTVQVKDSNGRENKLYLSLRSEGGTR